MELVNSYCTVVNDGMRSDPVLVTRIVDRDGNEIYKAPEHQERALTYRSAWLMQQMLMACRTDAGGTAMALNGYITRPLYDVDLGGKTGTSNRHADAWFVAVSPGLVCGSWVGGEYRQIHFRWGALGQGSRTALPICGRFLQLVLSDPQFQRYHQRFQPAKEPIDAALYSGCSSIVPVEEFDSTMLDFNEDSLAIPLNDDFNPDEKLEEPSSVPDSV